MNTDTQETKLLDLCAYEDLVDTLITVAKQEQIFDFHLFGDIKFIRDIGEELSFSLPLEYSIKDIAVKYN